MSNPGATPLQVFRLPLHVWVSGVVALAAGYVAFRSGVDFSAAQIWNRPEYSHGLVIPFIAAFLVWQHRDWLERTPFPGAWSGVIVLLCAVALNAVGQLASLYMLQRYSALAALYGLVLALVGGRVFRRLWVPLLVLLFMIPLPEVLYGSLSAQLQLLSSRAGVWVIRQFGISVFLEGNVIDLGRMQLQVAEACSGLRYLFPLMTLGFIAAYFFKAAFWKRLIVFLSSIPITVAMNSLRIGLIGVSVEYWGLRMAEGVLHDFEGWVVFMASGAVMLLEIVVLARVGRDRRPWRQVFGVELPPPVPRGAKFVQRPLPRSFVAAVLVLVAAAAMAQLIPERHDAVPARRQFVDFPMTLAGRTGARESIDRHLPGNAAARRLPAGELHVRGRGRCARQSLRGLVRHAAHRPRDALASRLPAGRRLEHPAAGAGEAARGAGRRARSARQSRNHPARGGAPARVLLLQAAPAASLPVNMSSTGTCSGMR